MGKEDPWVKTSPPSPDSRKDPAFRSLPFPLLCTCAPSNPRMETAGACILPSLSTGRWDDLRDHFLQLQVRMHGSAASGAG